MTQTVILTQPVRVAGSVLDAGTTQALADDIAADLVARGFATPVGIPAWQFPAQNVPLSIARSNIPFIIMPGDGGANGCSFSGTAGAFTLSAAIIANIGTTLAGCYAYFSASFGGSTLPSGWYWTEFSSDTAGIVYANTYTSGTPRRPSTKTPISVNLTGRITATTNEVIGPTGFTLSGNDLGKNGSLSVILATAGSTGGTKTYRVKIESTNVVVTSTSTSPVGESKHIVVCQDSTTAKNIGRVSASGTPVGIGLFGTSYSAAQQVSIDTSISQTVSVSLTANTSISGTILTYFSIAATYGE